MSLKLAQKPENMLSYVLLKCSLVVIFYSQNLEFELGTATLISIVLLAKNNPT